MSLTYTFVDLSNLIKEIGETDLNYAGNWSSGSTYFFGDVVLYSDTRYLALAASTSSQPPVITINDSKWSALVLAVTGTTSGSLASGAYLLADEAYGLATYAIALVGTVSGSLAMGYSGSHSFWVSSTGAGLDTRVFVNNGLIVDAAPHLTW